MEIEEERSWIEDWREATQPGSADAIANQECSARRVWP